VSDRPRLLVAVPAAHERLKLVAALRDAFEVHALESGQDPVREARRLHPALVLLAVPRGKQGEALRACRAMKTDAGSVARVVLYDPHGRLSEPESALDASLADGYLGDEAALLEVAEAALRGEVLVREGPHKRGWWR